MCTATVTTALVTTLLVLPVRPVTADPAAGGPQRLLTELRSLYQEVGAATDAYNATAERLRVQSARVAGIDQRLADARAALDAGRQDAGRLARQQYRGSVPVLPPYLRLLLGEDPQQAFRQSHLLQRFSRAERETLDRLTERTRGLERLAERARSAVAAEQSLTAERREQREAVRSRIRAVRELLAELDDRERARLDRLERSVVGRAQRTFLASGGLEREGAPSTAGQRALAYAKDQIGKPYAWGAQGPSSFDCSGLTAQAWAHAGHPIPRTSQDQWHRLPHVPVREVRPGDLVIYYAEATHVALYAGDGKVVHAPRPGETVQLAPIAVNPVLGAVRPDG